MTTLIESLIQVRNNVPPCEPPAWARNGHLQTILGHFLPSPKLSESGLHVKLALDKKTERIHSTYLRGHTNTVVYLFHGLGGSAESNYMHLTAIRARFQGHHVFLNNHRGCGRGVGLAMEPYHSGRADDISKIIEYGRQMLPNHTHIAVGFSLSANALLLLTAGIRGQVQPDFAIAVNAPIDLEHSSLKLQEGLNKL